jgi:hypothetical protein
MDNEQHLESVLDMFLNKIAKVDRKNLLFKQGKLKRAVYTAHELSKIIEKAQDNYEAAH